MNDMATTRMLLTTAVLAAVAALVTAPAHAYFADVDGGGAANAASLPTPNVGGLDPAIQTAIQAREATVPQTIPYLSHGMGVDQTLFGGQPSGDVDESRFAGDVARASRVEPSGASSSTADVDWTWIGLGSGLAAFLALATASLYLTARQRRGGVALP